MKKESFIDFIVRNRYVIICVTIVLILAFTGVIKMLMEVIFTALLLIGAIYLGKRIQDDERFISRMFDTKKDDIKYTVKDDDRENKE